MKKLLVPAAPSSIQKGVPLKQILDKPLIMQLGKNLQVAYPDFRTAQFVKDATNKLEDLSILERGRKIAGSMKKFLPDNYSDAVDIMLNSLTPPLKQTENNGLAVFFYLPHVCFVSEYGLDRSYNNNQDPFDTSMKAQYELTKRFTAEFSIRRFIIEHPGKTFDILYEWMSDPDPHVRRLCSEGTRPRLPWAIRIPALMKDPSPALPLLEKLKNDESLYVRRSVANHLADIAKDHPDFAMQLCRRWLKGASGELKWVIRHSLRYPAKKGSKEALRIRDSAR